MRSLTLFLFFIKCLVYPQGCSDAGFCTMGSLKPNQSYHKKNLLSVKTIEFSQYFGGADLKNTQKTYKFKDYFLSYIVDVGIGYGRKHSFQVKLPYNITIGNLATTSGIGDVSLSWSYLLFTNERYQLATVVGGKVPTSFGDLRQAGTDRPLPMYYQPSLGTYDVVAGISLKTKGWLMATGIQYPLIQKVENQFVWQPWNNSPDSLVASIYPRAYQLKRSYDLMVRLEKNLRFSNWNVYFGILPIYRPEEDEFYNPGIQKHVKIKGSNGVATSLLAGGGYRLNVHSSLKLLVGYRITKRKFNPDGLSRLFVTTFGYEYQF